MSDTGTPGAKSPLISAAERLIQILTEHPELEHTISSISLYGQNSIPTTGRFGILADGKDAVLQQWSDAIGGRISLQGRDLDESHNFTWMGAATSDDDVISVTISTDRRKA
jgi:hypothetical protein